MTWFTPIGSRWKKGHPATFTQSAPAPPRSIDEMLRIMLGLTQVDVQVETDPTLFRPGDLPILQADPRAFQEQTGWRTTIPLERDLRGYPGLLAGPSARRVMISLLPRGFTHGVSSRISSLLMEIESRTPSFPRQRESILAACTLDSGIRRNDGQEADHRFHIAERPRQGHCDH